MDKELIVLRGLPGSGKSTLAQVLSEAGQYPVYSIDDYFTDSNGHYHFRFEDNHKAYKQCQESTEEAMKQGAKKIFIDNVFSLEWEIQPYMELAKKYNYRMHVLTVENRHKGNNIHGVDQQQLMKMAEKFKVELI